MHQLILGLASAAALTFGSGAAGASCQVNFAGTVGGPVVHVAVLDKTCSVPANPAKITWDTGVFAANATYAVDATNTGFNFTCTSISTLGWNAKHADGGTGSFNLACSSAFSTGPLQFGP
jgi:hypothetical protein